jgi:aspartate oxidase
MSDRFPGEITIGGSIPRRLLDKLAGMVASEGVSIDWQYTLDKAAVRKAIEEAGAKGETVRFTDDEAVCGEFEDLENWLTSHSIDFDRHSDARYEYDGENAHGRGRKRPVTMNSDQSGNDLVSAEEVRRIRASQAPAGRKLTQIARLAAVPPALTPIVLTDRKAKHP